jgi:ribosomal-protein-alanine N-acetyltransferase
MINLRPIEVRDLPKMREWRNDEGIMQWCRQEIGLSAEKHLAWFQSLQSRNDVCMFAIEAQGVLVGVCGLTSITPIHRRAEFSLYIGPEYQRRGYAFHSLLELLRVGFKRLGLHVIWGETFEGNPAAKMFEKIGMTKEGTRRHFYWKHGRWIDAHLYSITEEECP